jgi:hypothetical protein
MPELHLSILFRFVLLLLAAVCSTVLSLFVYHSTVPPVSSAKRYVLISLRSVGLFLLFLLLGEPLLSLVTHSVNQPIVAIMVDNSQSMAITDRNGRRDETVKSILHSDVWKQIDKNGKLKYAIFDAKARYLATITDDSLTFKGEATDIAEAFKSVKQSSASSNLQAVVLITDGNSTIGMNPMYEAEESGVPVFSIGVGDTIEQKDLLIRKALTNDIAYSGAKAPVNVTVHSSGFGGERVQVSLRDGATILDEKALTLDAGTRDYLVPLSLVTEKEGMQKFTAEVSNLPGELTPQNNHMNFFIKVLKSKLRVALIAGSPSQDAAFIRRAMTNDKNIEIIPFIEQNDGQFYENILNAEALKTIDCVMLVGFPTEHSNPRSLQTVVDAADIGKPFFIILSRTSDVGRLHTLDPLLPFSLEITAPNELQVFAAVPETQRNNPILKISNNINTVELWSKLPPVFRQQGNYHSKIESEIFATVRLQSMPLTDPFIVARNVNKKKSLAVLGYGLWRWDMLSDAASGTDHVLEHFIGNAIRWLTTQEDSRKIRVQSSKHIYTTQDAVEFTAQVYDDNYQPLDDTQVEVRVQNGSETSPIVLTALGSGQYQGEFESLREGEYKFTAMVTANGAAIGTDQGTFSVGGLNAEFLEIRMNKPLLQQIAAQTGGRYYDADNFGLLAYDVTTMPNFKPRYISKSAEIEIWNSRWMLALVIFTFALEWFIRKRNGML